VIFATIHWLAPNVVARFRTLAPCDRNDRIRSSSAGPKCRSAGRPILFLPFSPVPCLLSPIPAAILSINCGPLLAVHRLPPVLRFLFFRPLDFAHRAFAALRAILCRSSADNFFSLALTDLRPISEKYFRRLFEITHVSLSCSTVQHHENAGPAISIANPISHHSTE
jgi:hypothetical protein